MERLPRAFGAVLSAVLLLAMALPALCGKCQGTAANPDCAQDHGGKTKQPARPSSGYTDCGHCDQSPGISANKQTNPGTLEFLIYLPDSPGTQRHDSNRIATALAASLTNSGPEAVLRYTFVGERKLAKSV